MKKINIFKINCQKIKILKIKHGATPKTKAKQNLMNDLIQTSNVKA